MGESSRRPVEVDEVATTPTVGDDHEIRLQAQDEIVHRTGFRLAEPRPAAAVGRREVPVEIDLVGGVFRNDRFARAV